MVVIQHLHGFAGALGPVPLQRAQQRVAQVVQVVQVNRRPAAHGPRASKRSGFNLYQYQLCKRSRWQVLTLNSCGRPAPARCGNVYQRRSSCRASSENWGTGSCILAWAPQAAHWHRWPIGTQTQVSTVIISLNSRCEGALPGWAAATSSAPSGSVCPPDLHQRWSQLPCWAASGGTSGYPCDERV